MKNRQLMRIVVGRAVQYQSESCCVLENPSYFFQFLCVSFEKFANFLLAHLHQSPRMIYVKPSTASNVNEKRLCVRKISTNIERELCMR